MSEIQTEETKEEDCVAPIFSMRRVDMLALIILYLKILVFHIYNSMFSMSETQTEIKITTVKDCVASIFPG